MTRRPRRGVDDRTRAQVFQSFLAGSIPWLMLAGLLAFMWPVRFGGTTDFIIVSGRSMERTYHTGDLVITKKRANYKVGDVIVYRIPVGGAGEGREVVHRLKEVLPDGRMLAQGDNNRTADPWPITTSDIVGSKWLMIAKGGVFLGFLRSILMLALLFGVLVTWVFWPRDESEPEEEPTAGEGAVAVAHEPHWRDDDAISREWDTLIASGMDAPMELPLELPETPNARPPALHWLDDDGVPDVWLAEQDVADLQRR